jgi:outer membrane putative beta-barrel porin/alpha-amylase
LLYQQRGRMPIQGPLNSGQTPTMANFATLADLLSGCVTRVSNDACSQLTRSDSFSDSVWGFGDLIPQAALRWNNGVHNWMTYITGDVPVGAYDSTRPASGRGRPDGRIRWAAAGREWPDQ